MIVFNCIEHGQHIMARVAGPFNPSCDRVISVVEHGRLLGGAVYQNYRHASICIHVAGFNPRWLRRDFIWTAFHYPFTTLACQRIFAEISSENQEALDVSDRLGFTTEAVLHGAYPDGDLVIRVMDKDKCKWLALKPPFLRETNRGHV